MGFEARYRSAIRTCLATTDVSVELSVGGQSESLIVYCVLDDNASDDVVFDNTLIGLVAAVGGVFATKAPLS